MRRNWIVPVVLLLFAACGGAGTPDHVQSADSAFRPSVERPAVVGRRMRVVIDEAHGNFHTAAGRYQPFARLLRADGLVVDRGVEAFSIDSLADVDLLVIANALPPSDDETASAFTAEEVTAVEEWVLSGGALLLIADHAPFGAAARALGAAFGVGLVDGHVRDPEHVDGDLGSPYILVFERTSGLVGDHPITTGRSETERIDRVVTFGGEALRPPARARPILLLAESAERVADPTLGPEAPGRSAAGMVQALAIEHGGGRVVVVGEAAVFTSQVIRGVVAQGMGREELRIGMSRTDTDNEQLALNTVRWLVGVL